MGLHHYKGVSARPPVTPSAAAGLCWLRLVTKLCSCSPGDTSQLPLASASSGTKGCGPPAQQRLLLAGPHLLWGLALVDPSGHCGVPTSLLHWEGGESWDKDLNQVNKMEATQVCSTVQCCPLQPGPQTLSFFLPAALAELMSQAPGHTLVQRAWLCPQLLTAAKPGQHGHSGGTKPGTWLELGLVICSTQHRGDRAPGTGSTSWD